MAFTLLGSGNFVLFAVSAAVAAFTISSLDMPFVTRNGTGPND